MRIYRVYIVDDEGWIIIGLKKMIEKSGLPFKVTGSVGNGVIALEEIQKEKPDLIFLDVRIPGYDGIGLLEILREQGIETKVVYLSGYAEFQYAQKAIRLGAEDYLLKPIEQEKINKVLERIQEKFEGESEEGKQHGVEEAEVSSSMVSQIIGEIQSRYTTDITLTELAEKYNVSVSHLSSLIKSELNLPFSEYITSKRIQMAKELLRDEILSIEQIAEQVGYHDYFYFTKVFKKTVGISPSKYRKNNTT